MRICLSILCLAACSSAGAQSYVVASPQVGGGYPQQSSYVAAPAEFAQPGCVGRMLGAVGRKLESYSWPRVRPVGLQAHAPAPVMYLVQVPAASPYLTLQAAPVASPQQGYYAAPPLPPVSPRDVPPR